MSIEERVLKKLRELPTDKQKEVLDFAESPERNRVKKGPLHSLEGLWADLDIHITEVDIAEAGSEMWGNLPRDMKQRD